MNSSRSPYNPSLSRGNLRGSQSQASKTPASILKKRVLVDRHVKITPKSKKQLQFSLIKSPISSPRRRSKSPCQSPTIALNEGDKFLSELIKFRKSNEELCVSRENRRQRQNLAHSTDSGTKSPLSGSNNLRRRLPSSLTPQSKSCASPAPSQSEFGQHACIHNYRVNERLFPEPIIADEQGRSICPICQRPEPSNPTERSPHFVRVSIPPGVIKSPIRVRPHRKKSFDPSDSFALSKHCLAGYVPPKSDISGTMVPNSTNFDLMSSAFGTKCHVTVTTRDLQQIAQRDRQVAEQRALSLGKRAAFNQSLTAAKRLQSPKRTGAVGVSTRHASSFAKLSGQHIAGRV